MKDKTDQLREKYVAIVMWCRELGSFDYYIDDEVHRADADKAPVDVIYKDSNDNWRTVRDLKPDHPFRLRYESYIQASNAGS